MNFANNQLLFSKTDKRDHRHHLSFFFCQNCVTFDSLTATLSIICVVRRAFLGVVWTIFRATKKTTHASCPTLKLKEAGNNLYLAVAVWTMGDHHAVVIWLRDDDEWNVEVAMKF